MSDWADDTEQRALVGGATDWDDDAKVPYATPAQAGGGAADWDDDTEPPATAPPTELPIGTFDFPDDHATPSRLTAVAAVDWEDDTPQPHVGGATTPAAVGVNDAGGDGQFLTFNMPVSGGVLDIEARIGFTGMFGLPGNTGGDLFDARDAAQTGLPGWANNSDVIVGGPSLVIDQVGSVASIAWVFDNANNTSTANGTLLESVWYTLQYELLLGVTTFDQAGKTYQDNTGQMVLDAANFGPAAGNADIGFSPQAARDILTVALTTIGLFTQTTIYLASLKIGNMGLGSSNLLSYDAAVDTIAAKFTFVDAGTPGWTDGVAPF